jgi:LuxR family maltose regulon positive regulatory protein
MPRSTANLHRGIGELYCEWGELTTAAQHLLRSHELNEQAGLRNNEFRLCTAQARIKVAQGDPEGALDLLDEAARLYQRGRSPDVRPIAALKTRVWLSQGRLTEALGWVRERGLSAADELSYLREFEHLTLARVLIARYRQDRVVGAVHEATALLKRLLKAAEAGERLGSTIEILALQALVDEAQGDIPAALVPLEQALTLAEPEGYVRLFVDEGLPMARLLNAAAAQGIMPDYADRLLAKFDLAACQNGPDQAQRSQARIARRAQAVKPLVEPLSERELEVLQLIAIGKKNQEIADDLVISLNTVRYHTKNLYGKLGVNKRTQAVAKAQKLGLI